MQENILNNIIELTDKRSKNQIIKDSCKEIRLTKKSLWQYVLSITVAISLATAIGISRDTVNLYISVTEMINNIMVAFVAMIFGSYSIFQALLCKEIVLELVQSKNNLLKESNKTFLNLIVLYIGDITMNIIIITSLKILHPDFLLFGDLTISNILAILLMFIHLFFSLLLILEVINFAINLYRMFCIYNTLKALEALELKEEAK